MRSVHFTDTYLPRRDGIITSIRTLTAAQRAAGDAPLTVVPRHPEQPHEEGVLRLRALPCGVADLRLSPWLLRASLANGALATVREHQPDVIHVHTPGPVGVLGVLAAKELGLPLVQTYHTDLHAYAEAYRFPVEAVRAAERLYAHRLGLPRPDAASGARADRRRAAVEGCNRLLLGDADAVVVPTKAVLDRIELPVDPGRVAFVPTGVAGRPTDADQVAQLRRAHRLPPAVPVVLFVGRVNREKGVDLLLAAFDRLVASGRDVCLMLIGAVYEPRWFANQLRLLDPAAAQRVVVAGQQPAEAVAAAYGAATVFAFPSRTDTQALVLQEAALAGLPTVLVDPVLHEHGPLGGAGILTGPAPVDFAAGLARVLDQPETARALGADAAANAARHTPARYAESIRDIYTQVIQRRS